MPDLKATHGNPKPLLDGKAALHLVDKKEKEIFSSAPYRQWNKKLNQIVEERLSLKDFNGAVRTALKTSASVTDKILNRIFVQCNDQSLMESIADKMTSVFNRQEAHRKLFLAKLLSNDYIGAIKSAAKFPFQESRDNALMAVALQSGDANTAETAALAMQNLGNQNTALEKAISFLLAKQNIDGAVRVALKKHGNDNIDDSLVAIIKEVKDLPQIESIISKIADSTSQDVEYIKLVNKKIAAGDLQGATSSAIKIADKLLRNNTLLEVISHLVDLNAILAAIDKIDRVSLKVKACEAALVKYQGLENVKEIEILTEKLRILKDLQKTFAKADELCKVSSPTYIYIRI